MHIVVRTRRVLAVHPWIHWAVCVGLAVAAAFATHGYIARLDAERRSWGTTHEVWVSADDIAAGEPIRATATEVPVALGWRLTAFSPSSYRSRATRARRR